MALKKIKTVKGFSAEYWRITQINSNFDRRDALITLSLYKDEATRNSNSLDSVDSYTLDIDGDFFDEVFNGSDNLKNIRLSKAYQIFKSKALAESQKPEGEKDESLAFFCDAEDC